MKLDDLLGEEYTQQLYKLYGIRKEEKVVDQIVEKDKPKEDVIKLEKYMNWLYTPNYNGHEQAATTKYIMDNIKIDYTGWGTAMNTDPIYYGYARATNKGTTTSVQDLEEQIDELETENKDLRDLVSRFVNGLQIEHNQVRIKIGAYGTAVEIEPRLAQLVSEILSEKLEAEAEKEKNIKETEEKAAAARLSWE